MSATLSRRAFGAGLALGVPAALLGKTVASQSILDPNGTGMDLESALLRVSPHYLRDLLVSTPFADGFAPVRWADVGESPYFTSVGGVNVLPSGSDVAIENLADSRDPNSGVTLANGSAAPIYRPEYGRTLRIGVRYDWK